MSQANDKERQTWMLIFICLPTFMLFPLASEVTEDGGTQLLVSGALGMLGVMVGLGLHALFGQSRKWVRILALMLWVAVYVGLVLKLRS